MADHPLIEIVERMNSYIRATQGNAGLHLPKMTVTIDTIIYRVQEIVVEVDNTISLNIYDTYTRSSWLTLPVESPVLDRLMGIVGIPSELRSRL